MTRNVRQYVHFRKKSKIGQQLRGVIADLAEHRREGVDAEHMEGHGDQELVKGGRKEKDGEHALAAVEARPYEGEIQVPHLLQTPQTHIERIYIKHNSCNVN